MKIKTFKQYNRHLSKTYPDLDNSELVFYYQIWYAWTILEHKWRYYIGRGLKEDIDLIGDQEYDQLEEEYKALCAYLDIPTSATDMVGFDFNRGSCKLVHHKLSTIYDMPKTTMVL